MWIHTDTPSPPIWGEGNAFSPPLQSGTSLKLPTGQFLNSRSHLGGKGYGRREKLNPCNPWLKDKR